ncbi:MAG TPA: DUF58 domain-containing protein [Verrucomicrobia bacterium]|nr:DUF58 domain-containing protein [Verrucomicrobiota bacterium]HOP96555.1 DUF58 domain-containing protein [Verrucomicrobiota bacterium]HPU56888.1 DUF58 domain-containing protein [Verrucomicrobiota bacterium]
MNEELRQALHQGEQLGLRYALQIPQVAASGLVGSRLGRRAGSSIDFQDYREYQPGDDLRFIDWGIYARTDRLSIKLFREEVTPHLDIVLDGSRSMNLEGSSKARAAGELAALLAVAAANAQCSRAVWLSGEGFNRVANDTHPPPSWNGLQFESARTLDQSCEILPPKLRRLGVRVLISDLLWPGNPVQTLRRLREGAAALFVVQLLGRDDANPPDHGSIRLVDSETGEQTELFVDSTVKKQYLENLAQWQQAWDDACRQCGARLTTVIAEDLESSLRELEAIELLSPA